MKWKTLIMHLIHRLSELNMVLALSLFIFYYHSIDILPSLLCTFNLRQTFIKLVFYFYSYYHVRLSTRHFDRRQRFSPFLRFLGV